MALGNVGISSLMRGAAAAREKQLSYNDQAAAYQYNTSAKTEGDYSQYKQYLDKRQASVTDPSKALTIQTNKDSAYSGFTSKEIQRQTMAVNYGEQDNRTKYNKILGLYQQALNTGNDNLAQSLQSNLASLSVTIQNEDQANASRAQASSSKAHNLAVSQATNSLNSFKAGLDKALKTGSPVINPADGQPLRFKTDKNGQLVLGADGNPIQDSNAQPLRLTDRNYRILVGNTMQQHASILQNEIDSGLDESGAKQAQLATLQASPDWEKFASTSINEKLQRGEDPYTMKVDELGNISVAPRTVTGQQAITDKNGNPVMDASGRPITANQYQTGRTIDSSGKASSSYDYYRKIGTDVNAPIDDYTQTVLHGNKADTRIDPITKQPVSTDNQDYVVDPVTGKTMYLRTYVDPKTGQTVTQRSLEPLDSKGNVTEASNFPTDRHQAALQNRAELGKLVGSIPGGIKTGIHALSTLGGAITNPMTLLNAAHNTKLVNQAEELRQATALANQRQAAVNAQFKPVAPSVPVTTSNGRVNNVAGPRAVTPALVKAQNTAGTPSFTQSLDPGILKGAQILGLNTNKPLVTPQPAPQPAAKPWWHFW